MPEPQAKSSDLLYESSETFGVTYYTYPGGKVRGPIQAGGKGGLCSDRAGDVYIVDPSHQEIFEYPHDSNELLNEFYDFGYGAFGCSSDPITGNLAVAGGAASSGANVAIYANSQDLPTVYSDPQLRAFYYCTYDNQGNLFAEGESAQRDTVLAELPKGSNAFSLVTLDHPLYRGAAAVQWDGTYLAVGVPQKTDGLEEVYQVAVSGSSGKVVKTVQLLGGQGSARFDGPENQFWIQGSTIILSKPRAREIGMWAYPSGGKARKFIQTINQRPFGITVSVGS
jgi:hypothetical protein